MPSGAVCAALLIAFVEPALAHRIATEDVERQHIAIEQDVDNDCLDVIQVRLYCPVGNHPGACYNSTDFGGVQCYSASDGTAGPEECAPGRDSRCSYRRYGEVIDDYDVPLCNVCETECQLLNNHWGACYASGTDVPRGDRCRCVPKADTLSVDAMHQADHCLTKRIGETHLTYDGICRFPTDISSFGLQECLDIPSFPGKCPIEHNPGACYRENGGWMCWAGEQWFTDRECREVHGFDGACVYQSFGQRLEDDDISQCEDVHSSRQVCDNCDPVEHWGGCYEESQPSHACLCAPRADASFIERMMMNSCRTQQVEGTDRAYSGVCRLPTPPTEPEERPECLEIETFHGQCPISEYQGACYREDAGDWRCWTEEDPKTPFDCRLSRDDSGHSAGYSGSCEFKDYGQLVSEEVLDSCLTLDKCMSQCEPVRNNWGACYPPDNVPDSESNTCLCAPRIATELIETDMLRQHSCETKKISGLDIAYAGVCRFPEDISEFGLGECIDLPHHAAKCSIESSPGACYSADEATPWSCWSRGTFFAPGECMSRGFTGACKFGSHNHTIAEEDIEECHELEGLGWRCAECDFDLHDLACYQADGDMDSECYCAPRGDHMIRASMLAHSCETRAVGEEAPGEAYANLCRVPELEAIPTPAPPPLPADPIYRCETVPTYHLGAGETDCLLSEPHDKTAACFSAEQGISWQCFTMEDRNERCSATRTTSTSGTFDGSCVYNSASDADVQETWSSAARWETQEEVITPHGRRRRTDAHASTRGSAPRGAPLASMMLLAWAVAAVRASRT